MVKQISNIKPNMAISSLNSYLRYGALHPPSVWKVRGLAHVMFLSGYFMNGSSHLFDSIDSLIRLSLANTPFEGADRWALSLYLFSVFHGLFIALRSGSRCSWKDLRGVSVCLIVQCQQ